VPKKNIKLSMILSGVKNLPEGGRTFHNNKFLYNYTNAPTEFGKPLLNRSDFNTL